MTITATTESGNYSDQIVIVVSESVNVTEQQLGEIIIYPNPSEGIFFIKGNPNLMNAELKIYDSHGSAVFLKNMESNSNKINLSHLSSGLYFLEIINKGKTHKRILSLSTR